MAMEIERKFLVDAKLWRPSGPGVLYRQGYLNAAKERIVRVRVAGASAFLTVKGPTRGIARLEFEYPIPLSDAEEMLDTLCEKPLVEKTRHTETWCGRVWEIDVFHGDNDGLIVAEVEIASASDVVVEPEWAVSDVSGDPRYFNNSLATYPFRNWNKDGGGA